MTELRLVKCYMQDCNNDVIGKIIPKRNPDKTPLFVCRYHYGILTEIHTGSEYAEGSGWFTFLQPDTREVTKK